MLQRRQQAYIGRGYADVSVNVQISTGGGADISAEDTATTWLYTDR